MKKIFITALTISIVSIAVLAVATDRLVNSVEIKNI